MEFSILGPVAARAGGRELPLGGPKQRALLAILLLRANEAVSRDRLIDGMWGERPPPTAAHTLDTYISRLRKTLGRDRLSTRAPGYVLHVGPDELDLDRFERLRVRGRAELARGDVAEAAESLRSALALWRGPALVDLLYEPFAAEEAERLEERRLGALEDRIDADLALGESSALVPELEALVREHAFRERLLAQFMLALYRAGRQAEALAALQTGRRRLAEALGLEPGPELCELQRKILAHDPSLQTPRKPGRPALLTLGRKRLAAVGAVVIVVLASAAVGIVLSTGEATPSDVGAGSSHVVGLSLASGPRSDAVPVTGAPAAMVAADGSLWLANPNENAVARLDLGEETVADRIPVRGNPGALAVGAGAVWAASVPGDTVTRIDPRTGTVTQTLPLGAARASALAFGAGALWVADITGDSLLELDADSGIVRRTLKLNVRPTALALGDAAIWVADYEANSVAEVDSRTGRTLSTVHVGNGPVALAVGEEAVWVANALDSTVSRIDPASGSVAATIPVGSGPSAIAVSGGSVWVTSRYSATVSRIDPDRSAVVETHTVRGGPTALAIADDRIWVGVRPLAQHRGGRLVLLYQRPISIDPALHLDLLPLVSDRLTRNGLVTYNYAAGPAGIQLVPDLAVSLPLPADGETTYTFRLRPGIRYSDGRPVRAADFRRAIERIFRLRAEGSVSFTNLRGAAACADPNATACDLSRGIVTDETAGTVSFRLRVPDPDFLETLTQNGLATPVPPGTPFRDTGFEPIPGTGPYKIARASRREIRYVRNPFFREWSHAARPDGNPDEIVMRFGLSPEQEVRAIEDGRADWMADFIPAHLLPRLRTRFASQLHNVSIPATDFFQLNSTLPPFDDVRVRRALNLAIDRRAIVGIYGGRDVATPTCQVLPPGVSGYRRYCPYTRDPSGAGVWAAPDLARARRLVAASGTRGTPVTVWGKADHPTISPRVVRYTARVLRRLGYPARVRLVPQSFLDRNPRAFETIQLIPASWGDAPYGFFATWFSCRGPKNPGWFCDPRLDRAILHAQAAKGTNPRAAAAQWARVDQELVDRAAAVPFVNHRGIDFVSARVRNYQFHPYWGFMADQVWVR